MGFFQVKKTIEATKNTNTGGGKYISESGLYDVVIKTASVSVNDHNARSINFNIEYEGERTTIYGLTLDKNNGDPIDFQQRVFNNLCVVTGVDEVSNPETETHNLGRDNTPTDLAVLTDFSDLAVKVWIQKEYNKYNGQVYRKLKVKDFSSEDDFQKRCC